MIAPSIDANLKLACVTFFSFLIFSVYAPVRFIVKGYCSRVCVSVGQLVCLSVCLSARFLSNGGSGGYQTWICGYVQRVLGTARVWSHTAKEQRV